MGFEFFAIVFHLCCIKAVLYNLEAQFLDIPKGGTVYLCFNIFSLLFDENMCWMFYLQMY